MSKYNYLNLNQKMIKIRKKLPCLMRKRYSEEVGYDFVKLDDINRFLTPALNRYGVDFDIMREIPTQTSESGAPVFLTRDENLWRYEADLEICWTNADHPEEKITSILHLIGTNDVADKAKGTALTYGLKYYLLNKFNIPQNAEDDPDMKAGKPSDEKGEKTNPQKEDASKRIVLEAEQTEKTVSFTPDAGLEEGLKKAEEPQKEKQQERKPLRNGNAVTMANTENMTQQQLSFPEETKDTMTFSAEEDELDFQAAVEDTVDSYADHDFRTVTEEDEIPFSEEETDMEDAFEETGVESEDERIEAAKAVICNFGLYKGKTLGEMLETQKGWESLKWLVKRYRGTNKEMVEAARILVDADAYHPDAA